MSKPLRAGRLRHRVHIEELVVTQDSDGDIVEDWVPFASYLPAEIVALSARELIAAQAVQSRVSTRITLRTLPGLLASMRIVHRGVIYNIEGVVPDPASGIRFVTLPCSSNVSQG
jgi:SPP1 family predicted phage head-tail adaptor